MASCFTSLKSTDAGYLLGELLPPEVIYGSVLTGKELTNTKVIQVGKIEVRVADQDSSSNIRVDLDIRGSDPQLTSFEALGIEQTDSTLIIKTPRHMHSNAASDIVDELPCIFVSATIWISPGTTLENFGINAETLSVIFQPGLQYSVKNRTEIYAHAAALSIEAHEPPAVELTSRDTIIHVKSGSVTGSYPLYDVLDISTISGSIDVTVEPKEASKEKVKPAVLRLSTTSGSINADTSVISVPDRDYQAAVSSVNGGINVKLLHGLRTSLRCESGHITADLYPYGHNDSRTDIQTKCTSGSTDITVHPSITHTSDPLKKLYAGHHGLSGSVNLWYPASWQGLVQGTTASGSISLDWQGLRIVKERKGGWVKKIIEAVRGEGEGRLTMFTTSGSIRLGGDSGGVFVGRKKKCNSMRTDAAQADGEDRFIQKMLGEK